MTKKSKATSRDRISRLFLWLDQNLDQLERDRKAAGESGSISDREKEARTMISLIRVYEKLVEMKEHLEENTQGDRKSRSSTRAAQSHDAQSHDEAEQKRREIARRIERLQQK